MENGGTMGCAYVNDLRRHFGRDSARPVLTGNAAGQNQDGSDGAAPPGAGI
jgi:hypothetical protein